MKKKEKSKHNVDSVAAGSYRVKLNGWLMKPTERGANTGIPKAAERLRTPVM